MRFDLIERFLSYTFQPLFHWLKSIWHNPIDSAVDAVVSAGEFVHENPITTIAFVGCAYYAHKRRWIRFDKWGAGIHAEPETPFGGANIHNSFYIGKKKII